jgi:hypothetical protein
VLVLLAPAAGSQASQRTTLPTEDRQRIAAAFGIADAVADSVWPGWGAVPFEVLLVTAEREFLIRPARTPPPGFEPLGHDSLLDGAVWTRPRTFPPTLLATFPAFGPPPTVVIGTTDATGTAPDRWVITLLHEHFHQLQMGDTAYYAAVQALGLARGDTTGMWQLNFPFPYDRGAVRVAYRALSLALAAAVPAIATDSLAPRAAAVGTALAEFTRVLPADALRYFWFQVWQEGVSRWTEVRVAEAAGPRYAATARAIRDGIVRELAAPDLAGRRRDSFYALGAGLALVLDATDPGWRGRYRRLMFQPLF